jgi:multisubunit Na+/H+ antiporter MnhB subunit
MVALLLRFPALRLLARALTLALIAYSLVALADAIKSDMNRSRAAAILIVIGFSVLLAALNVFVKRVFRTVP